jgi:hypothetical protein
VILGIQGLSEFRNPKFLTSAFPKRWKCGIRINRGSAAQYNINFPAHQYPAMSEKPTLLILGDPSTTVRHRQAQFKEFSGNFNVKVNVDLKRDSFKKALETKKYDHYWELLMRYGDFVAMMKPMVEFGNEIGRLDKELIDLLPASLKLIAAGGAGFDWADHEELGRRGTFTLVISNSRRVVLQRNRCGR